MMSPAPARGAELIRQLRNQLRSLTAAPNPFTAAAQDKLAWTSHETGESNVDFETAVLKHLLKAFPITKVAPAPKEKDDGSEEK